METLNYKVLSETGYNGKVKLVQPIGNFPQMADWINEQEGLYTLYLRGSEKGQKVDIWLASTSSVTACTTIPSAAL